VLLNYVDNRADEVPLPLYVFKCLQEVLYSYTIAIKTDVITQMNESFAAFVPQSDIDVKNDFLQLMANFFVIYPTEDTEDLKASLSTLFDYSKTTFNLLVTIHNVVEDCDWNSGSEQRSDLNKLLGNIKRHCRQTGCMNSLLEFPE
jgi:hypothetical protein